MKKIATLSVLSLAILTASCVSKKKYVTLQGQYDETVSTLSKTQLENERLETRLTDIDEKVDSYYKRIQSLSDSNSSLEQLSNSRYQKMGNVVVSENDKIKMKKALADVDPVKLKNAKTLQDSMNLIISHNLKKGLSSEMMTDNDDIDISIDETVVMITISDKMLFNSGSYRINAKANPLLEKLAALINSEPALEVMVEGHTDSQTVKPGAIVKDNWDLSVERSTAVIRKLQDQYNVAPEKLIAAGRSSYHPVTENDTKDGRSKNRRTRIVILPNLDKFLALLADNG
ncbi:putative flagellar motor protein MotB [unidentified eubacterium SCB49]|nr:putative flagellar motor protein MotB [unidentified eubacterium SCB49]